MKCDFKIMGVPKRISNIIYLCYKLGLDFAKDVAMDEVYSGVPAKTSLHAFSMPAEHDITHRCIIQDDIELCMGFVEAVHHLIELYPDNILSLYSNSTKLSAYPKGTIIDTGGMINGQALVIPLKYREQIIPFYRACIKAGEKADDFLYGLYAKKKGVKVLTCYPNLVKHMGVEDTTLDHKCARFKSHNYTGEDASKINFTKVKGNLGMALSISLKLLRDIEI